jgi:hypothetical protein
MGRSPDRLDALVWVLTDLMERESGSRPIWFSLSMRDEAGLRRPARTNVSVFRL